MEPAIGRDLLALEQVRKPGLLRQLFFVCVSSPSQIVSLQKLQGSLQDKGALETISHYLELLSAASLISTVGARSGRQIRQRSSPPKIVILNHALMAVGDPRGVPDQTDEPDRFGFWIENACLAFALNSGQRVGYWRSKNREVDGVLEGDWGSFLLEVKTGRYSLADLQPVADLGAKMPQHRPLLVCDPGREATARRAGIAVVSWEKFLLDGPRDG